MPTFHIRSPKPRNGETNEFYPDGDRWANKTLCGASTTTHDNKFGWQALPAGDYVPCEQCLAIKARVIAERRKRRQAEAAT